MKDPRDDAGGFTPREADLINDRLTSLTAAAVVLIVEVSAIGAGVLFLLLRFCK